MAFLEQFASGIQTSVSIQGKIEEPRKRQTVSEKLTKKQENEMQAYVTLQVIWLLPLGQQWLSIDSDFMVGAKWLALY